MKNALLLLSLFTLASCTPPPPPTVTQFYKKGGDQEALDVSIAKCKMQAQMLPNDLPVPDQNSTGGMMGLGNTLSYIAADEARENSFMMNCMRAQGWKWRQVPRTPDLKPAE